MRNFYVKVMQSLQLYLSTDKQSEQPQNLAAVGKKSRTSSISGEILHRLVVPPCQQNCPTFMSKKRQHGRATSFYHLRIDTCPNIKDRMRKDMREKTRRFSSEIESGREYSWENAKVYLCANTGAAPQIQDAG